MVRNGFIFLTLSNDTYCIYAQHDHSTDINENGTWTYFLAVHVPLYKVINCNCTTSWFGNINTAMEYDYSISQYVCCCAANNHAACKKPCMWSMLTIANTTHRLISEQASLVFYIFILGSFSK